MQVLLNNLRIPVENDSVEAYIRAAGEVLNLPAEKIVLIKILSKALDARSHNRFYYEISAVFEVPDGTGGTPYIEALPRELKLRKMNTRPVIAGFGPAGIFAALEFVENGICPVIIERGKRIEDRDRDISDFILSGRLNPESNVQFGEGGAGTYSDGKLFSRIKNSRYADQVLDAFIRFGAPPEIGYISKPHLGTDVLHRVVRNIRDYLFSKGAEIYFNSKLTDILISDGRAVGVTVNNEKEIMSECILLAVGHSARDVFELLHKKGIALEQKPIAAGVRIEHPAGLINLIRYGKNYQNNPALGAAFYSLTHTDRKKGRGIYSFCMCPGGEIVNASSEPGGLALNGMSYSARSSRFSNSAIVVSCSVTDYGSDNPLAGIIFQKTIEQKAYNMSGWKAPAQNLLDFIGGRVSGRINDNSYRMGTVSADLRLILPDFISEALLDAFLAWKEKEPLFISEEAVLLAPETRTSCPVRIKRNENFQSVNTAGLYPVGEGSGYAGGITSSAVDAIKAVEKILSAE